MRSVRAQRQGMQRGRIRTCCHIVRDHSPSAHSPSASSESSSSDDCSESVSAHWARLELGGSSGVGAVEPPESSKNLMLSTDEKALELELPMLSEPQLPELSKMLELSELSELPELPKSTSMPSLNNCSATSNGYQSLAERPRKRKAKAVSHRVLLDRLVLLVLLLDHLLLIGYLMLQLERQRAGRRLQRECR